MTDEGFIKIHRKILKWEWYDDVNVVKLFLHCLILANHKTKHWHGIPVVRGQFITSVSKLAKQTGLTVKQIRLALKKLNKTNEVASETTNRFTMITVNNYSTYHVNETKEGKQEDKQEDKQRANEGQTEGKQRATTKNVKNVKNDKKLKETYMDFVKLTKDEHGKLVKKFGEKGADDRIWNLNDYGHRKKKKFNEYSDHYRTILNWERRADEKDNRTSKRKPVEKAHSKSEEQSKRPTIITIED